MKAKTANTLANLKSESSVYQEQYAYNLEAQTRINYFNVNDLIAMRKIK